MKAIIAKKRPRVPKQVFQSENNIGHKTLEMEGILFERESVRCVEQEVFPERVSVLHNNYL